MHHVNSPQSGLISFSAHLCPIYSPFFFFFWEAQLIAPDQPPLASDPICTPNLWNIMCACMCVHMFDWFCHHFFNMSYWPRTMLCVPSPFTEEKTEMWRSYITFLRLNNLWMAEWDSNPGSLTLSSSCKHLCSPLPLVHFLIIFF